MLKHWQSEDEEFYDKNSMGMDKIKSRKLPMLGHICRMKDDSLIENGRANEAGKHAG
jgi:hypothetical protein